MSTNMNMKNTASASTAATPAPRLKWDQLDGIRTVIFVLYDRFPYWNASQYAMIINEAFEPQLTAMGFPDGIDNLRIGAEWRSRNKENAKGKWELGDDLDVSEDVAQYRDMWEAVLKIAAVKVGLQPRDDEDSENEDDDEGGDQEGEGGDEERKKAKTKSAIAAFEEKHIRKGNEGNGGDGGNAGRSLTLSSSYGLF